MYLQHSSPNVLLRYSRRKIEFKNRSSSKLLGVMDLEQGFDGTRYSLGIRNANDKFMRLALTVGYGVFVCDNMAFHVPNRC